MRTEEAIREELWRNRAQQALVLAKEPDPELRYMSIYTLRLLDVALSWTLGELDTEKLVGSYGEVTSIDVLDYLEGNVNNIERSTESLLDS